MDKQKRHREYRTPKNCQANNGGAFSRSLGWPLWGSLFCLGWLLLPGLPQKSERPLPDGEELRQEVAALTFAAEALPQFTADEFALAGFGRSLFNDKRFSANGEVACSTCHQPEYGFSDGRAVAEALGRGQRRTPSLINAFAAQWFFWDGRADSLAAQALGPIEHPFEHGLSRTHVVRLLRDHYRRDYEAAFGAFPSCLEGELPDEAMPAQEAVLAPTTIAAYSLASLDSFLLQNDIIAQASNEQIAPALMMATRMSPIPKTPAPWVVAWQQLSASQQEAINQVFSRFGQAIASYERGLVGVDAPFDRFARRLAAARGDAEEVLGDAFGAQELHGLKLFLGPGQCTNCHMGPQFSDQQFHNIGLDLGEASKGGYIDSGRAVGALAVTQNPFNCQGPYRPEGEASPSESCRELPWLNLENLEFVGAFKTPSLRNVALRPPYAHDGRFATLQDVLRHYNDLAGEPALGHREESLAPLGLGAKDLAALEAFLGALSSPVTDLTAPRGKEKN